MVLSVVGDAISGKETLFPQPPGDGAHQPRELLIGDPGIPSA
jgi:hypothetical protein